jgi:hypothetical protein
MGRALDEHGKVTADEWSADAVREQQRVAGK